MTIQRSRVNGKRIGVLFTANTVFPSGVRKALEADVLAKIEALETRAALAEQQAHDAQVLARAFADDAKRLTHENADLRRLVALQQRQLERVL